MKRYTASFWMVAILALVFGGTAFAQTAAPKAQTGAKAQTSTKSSTTAKTKAAPTRVATGTISSVDANKLVITHKIKGKDEPMTFMLAPDAKKQGPMDAGNKVTVRYHTDNGQEVATSVTGQAVTAKATTPKTGTKKAAGAKKS